IVPADAPVHRMVDVDWATEHVRPLYFVDVRTGYRCGWFHEDAGHLVMQPHPLSRCKPETWRTPDMAEIVGRVAGVVMRLNDSWSSPFGESPEVRVDSNKRDL